MIPVSVFADVVVDLGPLHKVVAATSYSRALSDQVYMMMTELYPLVQHRGPTF